MSYQPLTIAQTGDGYLAFFTGINSIAGDNDLFYDRANGNLSTNGGVTAYGGNFASRKQDGEANYHLNVYDNTGAGGGSNAFGYLKFWTSRGTPESLAGLSDNDIVGEIRFNSRDTNGWTGVADITVIKTSGSTVHKAKMEFGTCDGSTSSSPITRMVIRGDGFVELQELASEATSITSGFGALYAKTDGKLYYKAHDGTESDLTLGGASAVGSDGQVQYNNGGVFGGAAQFYYDDVNDRVGIGESSPSYPLHVSTSVANTVVARFYAASGTSAGIGVTSQSGSAYFGCYTNYATLFASGIGTNNRFIMYDHNNSRIHFYCRSDNATDYFRVEDTGILIRESGIPGATTGFGTLYVNSANGELNYIDESSNTYNLCNISSGSAGVVQLSDGSGRFTSSQVYWDEVNDRFSVGNAATDQDFEFQKYKDGWVNLRIRNRDTGGSHASVLLQEVRDTTYYIVTRGPHSTATPLWGIDMASSVAHFVNGGKLLLKTPSNFGIYIVSGGQYTATFNADQNLGLGTYLPHEKLTVMGAIAFGELSGLNSDLDYDGYGRLYVKSDDKLYFKPYGQAEIDLTAGGGGTPAGADTQIQFNNSGSFGGDTKLIWDYANSELEVDGYILPITDNTHGLGSPTKRWESLSLGPDSLHIISTDAETGQGYAWSLGIGTDSGKGNFQITQSDRTAFKIEPGGTIRIPGWLDIGGLLCQNNVWISGFSSEGMFNIVDSVNGNQLRIGTDNNMLNFFRLRTDGGDGFAITGNNDDIGIFVDAASGAYVGIGNTNPSEKLTVEGAIALDELSSTPGTTTGYGKIYASTDHSLYYKNASGTIYTLSGRVGGSGSANHIAIWTNSNTLTYDPSDLYWDSTNVRLGINTSSPQRHIHINGIDPSIRLEDTTYDDYDVINDSGVFKIYNVTDARSDIAVDGDGNITMNSKLGIGVSPSFIIDTLETTDGLSLVRVKNASTGTSARSAVQVVADVAACNIMTFSSNSSFTFDGVSLADSTRISSNGLFLVAGQAPLYLCSANLIGMAINTEGKVGIGTELSHEALTVNGIISLQEQDNYNRSFDGYGSLWAKSDGTLRYGGQALATSAQGADGYVAFFTGAGAIAGDNDLYWDREKNWLGVGTSSPAGIAEFSGYQRYPTVYISGYDESAGVLSLRGAKGTQTSPAAVVNSNSLGYIEFKGYDGSNWGAGAYIFGTAAEDWDGSGHGGAIDFYTTAVNSTSGDYNWRMRPDGSLWFKEFSGTHVTPDSSYGSLVVKTDGLIYLKNDGGTEYDLTAGASDIRLKRDITPLNNALDNVLQLNGVQFYWKDPDREQSPQIGLIAQETEKVLPELVQDGKTKTIKYHQLTAVLVEAVKDLKKENDSLRAELNEIKNLLNQGKE